MKTKRVFPSRVLALALLAAAPCALAQTSAVPKAMTYQGLIGDANGNLVGSPTPVNRTIIFRVWDNLTATAPVNLLYSEQQIVTIANGEFNVLVGQGLQVGTEPKPDFDSVFNGAQRFLGVTVDDGTAAADPEIAPRQQLVTSAFAFRAKTAEGVPANAITSSMLAAGAVTTNSIAAGAIDTSKLATGAVTAASIAAGAIDSSKLAAGSVAAGSVAAGAVTTASIAASAIDSSKLAAGAVTAASIADNAIVTSKLTDGSVTTDKLNLGFAPGVWSSAGGDVYRGSGRVGIRTSTPQTLLHLLTPSLPANPYNFEALRITGASRDGADPVHGVAIELDRNVSGLFNGAYYIGGNRAITIGDSARLGSGLAPLNHAKLRLGTILDPNGSNGGSLNAYIDVRADDGSYKNLLLCPFGGVVEMGGSAANGSLLGVGGNSIFDQFDSGSRITTSDARIKSIVARSNPGSDLELIRKLQVTDYRMIDEKNLGNGVQKGFIAQEVREIVPEAVKKVQHSFIPSIYAPATAATFDPDTRTLRIFLEKAHGLEKGDTVQVKDKQRSWELNVSETIDATTFVAGPVEGPISEPFVYGKRVDDFMTVDYNRLFTSGLGAIQDLASQVDAIQSENAGRPARLAASERRFADLEAADKVCDARLAAIEKTLRSSVGAVGTAAAEIKEGAN